MARYNNLRSMLVPCQMFKHFDRALSLYNCYDDKVTAGTVRSWNCDAPPLPSLQSLATICRIGVRIYRIRAWIYGMRVWIYGRCAQLMEL